ncbi:core protein [Tanapox virus]|uniref:25 kDa core protein OPG138 n=1 Tax=Tanapox virus TaxID=99000 RepID=A7XCN3_9POXV|nr:core protein [Tanapox virus]ABQ43733.1 core protein [Tanapox virus]
MADKKLARSSYDDYIETINKLTPQLRTILAHISGEQQGARTNLVNKESSSDEISAGTTYSKLKTKKSTKGQISTKSSGAPLRKKTVFGYGEPQIMQAVTNGGKIVYGTVKEGKLEVQGMVGEVNQDLLGIESVNAGKKVTKRQSTKKLIKGGLHKSEPVNDCCSEFGMK